MKSAIYFIKLKDLYRRAEYLQAQIKLWKSLGLPYVELQAELSTVELKKMGMAVMYADSIDQETNSHEA